MSDAIDIIKRGVLAGVTAMAHDIERKAKQKCPVRTGTLRRSIEAQVEETDTGANAVVGSQLEYAPFVHEGTGVFSRSGSGRQEVPWVYADAAGNFHTTSGIQGTPFLEEAAQECFAHFADYFSF